VEEQKFRPSWWSSRRWFSKDAVIVHADKVVLVTGVIGREERQVPFAKITDITVKQGCIGGILGLGSIFIQTAGSSGVEIVMHGMPKPRVLRDLLMKRIEKL